MTKEEASARIPEPMIIGLTPAIVLGSLLVVRLAVDRAREHERERVEHRERADRKEGVDHAADEPGLAVAAGGWTDDGHG